MLSAIFSGIASHQQGKAAEKAGKQARAEINEQQGQNTDDRNEAYLEQIYGQQGAQNYLNQGYGQAMGTMDAAYGNALGAYGQYAGQARQDIGQGYTTARAGLDQGYRDATGAITGYGNQALGALGSGYDQARTDMGQVAGLQQYGAQAAQSINPYDVMAQDPTKNMYGSFEADPGYQFRLQQGNEAIMNRAAASGGRMGGDTLKALADYNQGMASQEFGNYAQRAQFQAGLQGNLLMNQAGRTDAAGLAAQANQYGLAQTGYGAQAQMAGMANQYGQNAANLYGNMGSQLSGAAQNYGQNLANMGMQRGQMLGNLSQQTGQGLANLYTGYGQNMAGLQTGLGQGLAGYEFQGATNRANTIMGNASLNSGLSQAAAGTYGAAVPNAGAGWNAAAQTAGSMEQLATMYAMGNIFGPAGGA